MSKRKKPSPWLTAGCCEGCWNAKGKRCTCRCNSKFHGAGVSTKNYPRVDEFNDHPELMGLLFLEPAQGKDDKAGAKYIG